MYAFLDGNEAVVLGALQAGCRFFAGYPITPATSILLGMLRALPPVGGVALQAEDEIASIGLCIGASMGGLKAMTATSGPGISLYSENIGLAIMGEVPLVIVDVQRQGPATGSATQGAEGDIAFLRWGTSGGLPVVVLSPSTVAECYRLTVEAFNVAERLRSPVFLASSKELALTRERVSVASLAPLPVEERVPAAPGAPYLPYAVRGQEEVPAFAPIGGDQLVRFTASTHVEAGNITGDPARIGRLVTHLAAKITAGAPSLTRADLREGAQVLVVAYGVVARAAREAVQLAHARGRRVSLLTLQTLFPVPEAAIQQAAVGVRRAVVPELNLGQYRLEVERLLPGCAVVGVNKMNTELLSPQEILEQGGLWAS
ncbi:MAG: pyruvate flavodoxin/ferredoxin oxidoreductase [Deltaproteobacteria bacterium]|nr:pyruvate flavodoxin/ferredoxin oxidoreductase [Deltaproteobacteria bacterium]